MAQLYLLASAVNKIGYSAAFPRSSEQKTDRMEGF